MDKNRENKKWVSSLKKRKYLTIAILSVGIAVILSGTALFSLMDDSGADGYNGGIIPLKLPSFISMVGANTVDDRNGTSFLQEEAGISAYVNIGRKIDLGQAKNAFKSLETPVGGTYLIGEIGLTGLPEWANANPHVYVHEDGWILAYYSKNQPASKIMYWFGYTGGVITTNNLEEAIKKVCLAIPFDFSTIKDNIGYYDFKYPDATSLMLIVDRTGTHDASDYFLITIPTECIRDEYSWVHYFNYYDDIIGSHNRYTAGSTLSISGEGSAATLSLFNDYYGGNYYRYGYYKTNQLVTPGIPYQITVGQNLYSDPIHHGDDIYAYTNTATVLIYHTS